MSAAVLDSAPARPILELENVSTYFAVRTGTFFNRRAATVKAVDGINLTVAEGEVLGLVGESGCGKSTLARTIVGLVPLTAGHIRFSGGDWAHTPRRALRRMRPQLQMVFQDPYASLNPRMTVGDAIGEPMLTHGLVRRNELNARVSAMMERVGLARNAMRKYPHEFSGGQRQRIAIARALGLNPRMIIADEPVSALDVSVQAQILNLLGELCRDQHLTLVLISHDLSVVRHLSRRIAVMYLGKIVEIGPAASIFEAPSHPYTRALLSAVPMPDPKRQRDVARILLQGDPPSPIDPPEGCPFHPRCPYAIEACAQRVPDLYECATGQRAACIRIAELPPWKASR